MNYDAISMLGLASGLRHDGWQNSLTGLGIAGLDKSRGTTYVSRCDLGVQQLTAIYRDNWLARKIVEGLPRRAFAKGFDESTPMPDAFDAVNYAQWDEGALMRAICLGRLFGGAMLFIGYGSGGEDLTQPVASKGDVRFLDVFTRHELKPAVGVGGKEMRDADPMSPTAGQVRVYEVIGAHPRRGMRFHVSRAIKFSGLSLPPESSLVTAATASTSSFSGTTDPYYRDWSDSVLRPCWEDVERFGVMWQSVAHMLSVASVGVVKIGNLMQALNTNSGAVMKARVDLMNQMLSLTRNILLDSNQNEDYDRKAVNFADIPQLLDQMSNIVAGAADQPATELFGRAPQGMNATGESDQKIWEARVTEWQNRVLTPAVNVLAEAFAGTPTEIKFPNVHIETETELQDLRFKRVQTDEKLWSIGAVSPQEIRDAWHDGVQVEVVAVGPAPEPEPPPEPPAPVPPAPVPPAPGA